MSAIRITRAEGVAVAAWHGDIGWTQGIGHGVGRLEGNGGMRDGAQSDTAAFAMEC